MIDGFTKDEIMEKLIESLIALKPEDIPQKQVILRNLFRI